MSELHVIFGTGPVGCWTARALREMDLPVRAINRNDKHPDLMPTEVEIVKADASAPKQAIEAAQGAAVIYQSLNPPYHKWHETRTWGRVRRKWWFKAKIRNTVRQFEPELLGQTHGRLIPRAGPISKRHYSNLAGIVHQMFGNPIPQSLSLTIKLNSESFDPSLLPLWGDLQSPHGH